MLSHCIPLMVQTHVCNTGSSELLYPLSHDILAFNEKKNERSVRKNIVEKCSLTSIVTTITLYQPTIFKNGPN